MFGTICTSSVTKIPKPITTTANTTTPETKPDPTSQTTKITPKGKFTSKTDIGNLSQKGIFNTFFDFDGENLYVSLNQKPFSESTSHDSKKIGAINMNKGTFMEVYNLPTPASVNSLTPFKDGLLVDETISSLDSPSKVVFLKDGKETTILEYAKKAPLINSNFKVINDSSYFPTFKSSENSEGVNFEQSLYKYSDKLDLIQKEEIKFKLTDNNGAFPKGFFAMNGKVGYSGKYPYMVKNDKDNYQLHTIENGKLINKFEYGHCGGILGMIQNKIFFFDNPKVSNLSYDIETKKTTVLPEEIRKLSPEKSAYAHNDRYVFIEGDLSQKLFIYDTQTEKVDSIDLTKLNSDFKENYKKISKLFVKDNNLLILFEDLDKLSAYSFQIEN